LNKASDRAKGIFMIISAAFFFAGMGVFVKLAGNVPSMQKAFFRNAVAALFAFCILLFSEDKFKTKRENLKYLLGRSVCGTVGIIGNFYAIDHMSSIADASMLNKLSPFFATVFSFFILKEKMTVPQLATVIIAFLGSMLVVKPSFDLSSFLPGLVGFMGGMGAGMAYTFVRLLSEKGERKPFIVFFFSLFSCVAVSPWLILDYHPMTLSQTLMLVGAGLCACGGQFSITSAYSYAPAKEISVFDYTQIIFSTLFGMILFDQLPDAWSILGYAIIILMAVLTALRQRKE